MGKNWHQYIHLVIMRIDSPSIKEKGGQAFLESSVVSHGQRENLWFSVDSQYKEYLSHERLDAFVVGLLPSAMQRGENIYVSGPVSEKLYYHLTRLFMRVLSLVIPSLKPVEIIAPELDSGTLMHAGSNIGTGFSGGIDSFCLLAEHLPGCGAPVGYEISHLVYNHVGPPQVAVANQWQVQKLRREARSMQMPLIEINSNLDIFYSLSFILSYVPRNLAAILAIQKFFLRYLFASSYSYSDFYVGPCEDIGHCHGVCLPLLSTENMEFVSSGEQYSRVEKTRIVSDFAPSYTALDICTNYERNYEKNCSYCRKCLRTLLTLELLGKLDNYRQVFDMQTYKKHRNGYIEWLIHSHADYESEIKQLAQAQGIIFPMQQRVLGHSPFYEIKQEARHILPEALKASLKKLFHVAHS